MKAIAVVVALVLMAGVCFAQPIGRQMSREVKNALESCEVRNVKVSEGKGETQFYLKDKDGNEVVVASKPFELTQLNSAIEATDRTINQLKNETERKALIDKLEAQKAELEITRAVIK